MCLCGHMENFRDRTAGQESFYYAWLDNPIVYVYRKESLCFSIVFSMRIQQDMVLSCYLQIQY